MRICLISFKKAYYFIRPKLSTIIKYFLIKKKKSLQQGTEEHTCNPSYLGGLGKRIPSSGQPKK